MRRRPLTPLASRATFVFVVFSSIVVTAIVSAWSNHDLIGFLDDVRTAGGPDEARALALEAREHAIGLVQLGTTVLGAVSFLLWFHKAHENLGRAGLERLTYSPSSAVWSFFIPILSLFRPCQVMTEVARGSSYLSGEAGASHWRDAPAGALVGLWWALYLASSVTGLIGARVGGADPSVTDLITGSWITFASDVLDVPAAVAAVLLVRRITRQQATDADRPDERVFD